MAFYNFGFQPYTFNVSCPFKHVGYIIGRGGRGIENLKNKWNGKIIDIILKQPEPKLNRHSHHFTVIGEEKAVHFLCLEINEMIKISMTRMEIKMKGEINTFDKKQFMDHSKELKIAMLLEHVKELEKELAETKNDDNDGWGYGSKFECNGCIEDQPNQLAHMELGGCLYKAGSDCASESDGENMEIVGC
jgi:hypothetical protein